MRCDIYGGNMVAFSERVREFFTNLEKCNITPVLVFDGSVIGKQSTKDQLLLKEKTIYQRGSERFKIVREMTEHSGCDNVILPQNIANIFRNMVADMGIERIQSPYEADTHVARIANDLGCHALTNDSDFLIYSLPVGFIMLDSFMYKNITTTGNRRSQIECVIYSQNRLIRCLPGIRAETMPLLSVLLGNDYVDAGTFDTIMGPICNR